VTISNTSPKYAAKTVLLEKSNHSWEVADGLGTGWTAYAKASIAEVIAQSPGQPVSMQWLVDGVIPEGAGLSVSTMAQSYD
jgi:galactokinase